ncbi:hypothetical protein LINPERPRIM_LOCUS15304 [Linum perenne]
MLKQYSIRQLLSSSIRRQQFSVFVVNKHLGNNTFSGAIPSSVKLTGGRQGDSCGYFKVFV